MSSNDDFIPSGCPIRWITFLIRPCGELTTGLANNHSVCQANDLDAAWYRSFSGAAPAAKGSVSITNRVNIHRVIK
jgi:hypothetical protein